MRSKLRRSKAVEESLAALEAEKEAMKSRDTSDDADVMHLEVEEKLFMVQRSNLYLIEGSMLASQFSSGRGGRQHEDDEDGRILQDCDPDEFALTLKELRRCAMDRG